VNLESVLRYDKTNTRPLILVSSGISWVGVLIYHIHSNVRVDGLEIRFVKPKFRCLFCLLSCVVVKSLLVLLVQMGSCHPVTIPDLYHCLFKILFVFLMLFLLYLVYVI